MLKDLKSKVLTKKTAIITSISSTSILLVSNFASATGGDSSAVVTALQQVANDITSTFTSIAPVALGIAGTFLVWRYGMKFFKAISK